MTRLLLHHATLIDGTGADPVPSAALLIDDGRISWAGAEADLPASAGEAPIRVDLAGHTVYPGSSIEHGYQLDDDLRARMVDQCTYLVPTLLETMADVATSPTSRAKSARWHQMAHDAVGASAAAGVKIALGTDAGLGPTHGTNLQELGLLVRLGGLTPMEAIVAGTHTSAELCGLASELGTIEAGKIADVVVVRGDPLADIDAVGKAENVLLVLKDGAVASNRGGFLVMSGG